MHCTLPVDHFTNRDDTYAGYTMPVLPVLYNTAGSTCITKQHMYYCTIKWAAESIP